MRLILEMDYIYMIYHIYICIYILCKLFNDANIGLGVLSALAIVMNAYSASLPTQIRCYN